MFFFFSSRRRHTRCSRDWSSDVCSSDLLVWHVRTHVKVVGDAKRSPALPQTRSLAWGSPLTVCSSARRDRKSTRLNSSHGYISYAVFCLKKKKTLTERASLRHCIGYSQA